MESGTLKTRVIFVATRGKTALYHDLDEMPPSLRRKLARTTRGVNSGTVLIADRRGLQELIRSAMSKKAQVQRMRRRRRGEILMAFAAAHWPELGLSGALVLLLWLALFFR
ncbi:MAG: hypothetical protein ACM3ZB_02775 [bacterium]|jgi:hypothetical protein